jgi:hypothetical protein
LCAISTGTVSASDIIDDPTRRSLIGIFLGQLIFGVLGVLVMSAEYGTGTIRATLSALPRRPVVLTAKVFVFGAVALVVSEVLTFSAFAVGQALLSAKHAVGSSTFATQHAQQLGVKIPHDIQGVLSGGSASLGQPGVLRAVVGGGLYLAVLGLPAHGRCHLGFRRGGAGPAPHRPGIACVAQQCRGPLPAGQHWVSHVLYPWRAGPRRTCLQPMDWLRHSRAVHRGDPGDRLLGPCAPRRLSAACPLTSASKHAPRGAVLPLRQRSDIGCSWIEWDKGAGAGC